jgi:hypothetical protein
MATIHGVTVTDQTAAGSPNVKTTVNVVPFVMGNANGLTGGDAPETVIKINNFEEYKATYGWAGASDDEPDVDYSLEVFAYLFFRRYKNTPVIMRNIYNSTDHPGGVGDVVAADFTAVIDDIDKAYTQYGIVPAFFAIPNYSSDPTLRTAMFGKVDYQAHFTLMCVVDGDETSDVATIVTDATAIVTDNVAYTYPKYGGYALSSHFVAMAVKAARENSDVPYRSPSNYDVANGGIPVSMATADKSIGLDDGNTLADAGVVTRCAAGTNATVIWNSWMASYGGGSGTADYLNDTYIPRAMGNYIRTLVVLNLWENIDNPTNKNLINAVVTKLNAIGGSLQGLGALIGFEVEFLEADNPDVDLAAGKITFRLNYLTPKEASNIEVLLVLDTAYFATLFA